MASRRAKKLLLRMRQSKSGWSRDDLLTVYNGYGFDIRMGKKHDVVKHPKYPQLRATVTRSSSGLARGYITAAIGIIDKLVKLQKGEDE